MLHLYTVYPCTCSLRCSLRSLARCPCCSLRLPARARCAVHVLRPDRFQPLAVRAARCAVHLLAYVLYRLGDCYIFNDTSPGLFFTCARLPAPVCASADAWSTVDFFVRRPCVACLACPRVCSLALACVRARGLAPMCAFARVRGRACSRCSRLYGGFSRRASARWACRKLF